MFKVRYKITVIFQQNKFIKIKAKYIKKNKRCIPYNHLCRNPFKPKKMVFI